MTDVNTINVGGNSYDIQAKSYKGQLPIANGGTGASTAANALANIGAAPSSHNHSASNITSGTLPISRGGTGATTAANALAALGGISMKKIWTNASPTSAFPAQTVNISTIKNYDFVLIRFSFAESLTGWMGEQIVKVGETAPLSIFSTSNDNTSGAHTFMNTATRIATVNSTNIVFTTGAMIYAGGAYPNWTNRAIPQEVYGINGIS